VDAWEVITSEAYDGWFEEQTDEAKTAIRGKVYLLGIYGPYLGRPHVDTLKGSRLANLKELRTKTGSHVFRIAFVFDPERRALLLTGGDKKGKNERKFYQNLIRQAEEIYAAYQARKAGLGGEVWNFTL